MLQINVIINNPIPSNCYVIYSQDSSKCLVVDPGSENIREIKYFLNEKNLLPEYIILTHEHFDHIWSVNKLKNIYLCKIISSRECSESITDPKKNMSVFYKPPGFAIDKADVLIDHLGFTMHWNAYKIIFYTTPGHTNGSICFTISNYLFTGDTLINGKETVTRLPGGSKFKLSQSLKLLNSLTKDNTIILSGHGESFSYKKLD